MGMEDKSKLILMIDDDANFREIVSMKLGSAGYRVEMAEDGETGIRKMRDLHPTMVLLDMQMPGMSGADVVFKVKDDPDLKTIPILFLSSLGDPDPAMMQANDRLAIEIGTIGYLKKTDDLDSLLAKIKEKLGEQ